ncbi:MAG: phosphotransferase family protein [Sphingomicrobium sp.]
MSVDASPELVAVLPNHRFDEAALAQYLSGALPGFSGEMKVRQFQGGQSNPTFHLETAGRVYVLRKKPPGQLLPGAHAIDREYRVQQALHGSGVPVPKMLLLCLDETVIGQSFYVMEHVEGRIFTDRLLDRCTPGARAAMYDAMNAVLATLHGVNFRASGLSDFGRADQYVARQVSRWSRNYQFSKIDELPAMDGLIDWLEAHAPVDEEGTIVHGDYRLGNLVFHPTEPCVVAVLDWELATIGHPLADLAYNCLPWRLPVSSARGFADVDFATLGIPSEADYVAAYARRRDRAGVANWHYFLIFSMFRSAAILAGVYRRAIDGTSSDSRALAVRDIFRDIAGRAWTLAEATTIS